MFLKFFEEVLPLFLCSCHEFGECFMNTLSGKLLTSISFFFFFGFDFVLLLGTYFFFFSFHLNFSFCLYEIRQYYFKTIPVLKACPCIGASLADYMSPVALVGGLELK